MASENSKDDLDESVVYDDVSSVEEKCEEYIELYRTGDAPTFAQFAARTPELETQILELLPTIVMMEGARNRSLMRRRDGRVMRGHEQIPKLGDYRIVREIGRGGMGIVYEAHQLTLNRLVAIKLLPKYMLNDDQVLKFKLEASTAAKLHHTNIAPIYGVGESSGYHFYAMQLLEGVSLDRFVDSEEHSDADRKRLALEQVISVGRQVAAALQYAHDQGVLHRDIKPSNLILDSEENVWMTDFGLAISRENASTEQVGSTSGTLRYMAPEKFDDATDDVTGDIYSLGVTLIELLSGRAAFDNHRIGELTTDIKEGKLDSLTYEGRPLSGDLESVLRKSIAVDPAKRYQSASDFELDLRNVSETRPVSARRATMVGSAWRWVKRNRALAAASAIALEMLIATSVISTLAYFQVEEALDAERRQRVRTETTSRVASDAMDKMFRQFSSGTSLIDRSLETNQSFPLLNNESAALAQQLSGFYSQLASQNIDDAELPVKALAARSRVGELNERLGLYSEATMAFQSAIHGYESLIASRRIANSAENAIEIAQLTNQLGLIKNTSDDIVGAEAEHQKAIDLLTSRINATKLRDDRLELELARSFYLKARRSRPGMGPNSFPPVAFSLLESGDPNTSSVTTGLELSQSRLDSLQNAIGLLKTIIVTKDLQDDFSGNETPPEDDELDDIFLDVVPQDKKSRNDIANAAKFLLALCYRELANDNWSERSDADREYQRQANELLEYLVDKCPTVPIFQFELMRTLAEINVFESAELSDEAIDEAYHAVQRATDIGAELTQSQPGIAIFRVELIHCNFKLGRIAELKSRLIDSETDAEEREDLLLQQEQSYRWAMQRQTMLVRLNPNSSAYRVWATRFMLSLAACETMQSRVDARNRLIGRATAILNRLPQDVLDKPEVVAIMSEAQRMNQRTLAEPVSDTVRD